MPNAPFLKIEVKPPVLSVGSMSDPVAIALHLLHVETTAFQLGIDKQVMDKTFSLTVTAD